jgi:hypothetical protein
MADEHEEVAALRRARERLEQRGEVGQGRRARIRDAEMREGQAIAANLDGIRHRGIAAAVQDADARRRHGEVA